VYSGIGNVNRSKGETGRTGRTAVAIAASASTLRWAYSRGREKHFSKPSVPAERPEGVLRFVVKGGSARPGGVAAVFDFRACRTRKCNVLTLSSLRQRQAVAEDSTSAAG
jgi:hypothetical protein